MAKSQFREEIAQKITAERILEILDKCMDEEANVVHAKCPKRCCNHYSTFRVSGYDAKLALDAAKFAVEQGYGRVPNAKPVEEINFADRDPLAMSAEERGQLFEKVLGLFEGKALPPTSGGTLSS